MSDVVSLHVKYKLGVTKRRELPVSAFSLEPPTGVGKLVTLTQQLVCGCGAQGHGSVVNLAVLG